MIKRLAIVGAVLVIVGSFDLESGADLCDQRWPEEGDASQR
ncbi:hypothetical protein ACWDSL_41780 [Streptomyces sp. NPDC000941]